VSTAPAKGRIEYVELLRFVLALAVVVYHYYFWGPHHGTIRVSAIDGRGFSYLLFAVEAFFAVSGFVILLSAENRSPLAFLVARLARLGPTLLVASSVTLIAYFLIGSDPAVGNPIRRYLVGVMVAPLLRFDALDQSLWSLKYELRFYALIFVCMCLTNVERHALKIAAAMLIYDGASCVVPYALAGTEVPSLAFFAGYAPYFVIGILLYVAYSARRVSIAWFLLMLAALVLGSIQVLAVFERVNVSMLHLQAPRKFESVLVACAIPCLVAVCLRSAKSPFAGALCRVAGRASFPLYVVHQMCGYWIINLCTQTLHLRWDPRPAVAIAMIAFAVYFGNRLEPRLIVAYRRALDMLAAKPLPLLGIRINMPKPAPR
jgi:peptidoglycan/LPS O-acetylase OafA/YrhL